MLEHMWVTSVTAWQIVCGQYIWTLFQFSKLLKLNSWVLFHYCFLLPFPPHIIIYLIYIDIYILYIYSIHTHTYIVCVYMQYIKNCQKHFCLLNFVSSLNLHWHHSTRKPPEPLLCPHWHRTHHATLWFCASMSVSSTNLWVPGDLCLIYLWVLLSPHG